MQRHHSHRDLKEAIVGSCFQNERGNYSGQFVTLNTWNTIWMKMVVCITNEAGHRCLWTWTSTDDVKNCNQWCNDTAVLEANCQVDKSFIVLGEGHKVWAFNIIKASQKNTVPARNSHLLPCCLQSCSVHGGPATAVSAVLNTVPVQQEALTIEEDFCLLLAQCFIVACFCLGKQKCWCLYVVELPS